MKLYGYWRSSAAYRTRIALNLKGLAAEHVPVDLSKGAQSEEAYRRVNPEAIVPTLVDGDVVLGQSLAILEYLDETHPEPPLLPDDAAGRARVRGLAQLVACDMHPLNNTRVLLHLRRVMKVDKDGIRDWYHHWIARGFTALEARLAESPETGRFCHGDAPTMADCCLVPQVYNARRYDCDLSDYPTITRIEAACLALPAFDEAVPENQPDYDGS